MKRPTFDLTPPGWLIALAVLMLVAIGTACIYVTDTHYTAGHDGPANALRQVVRVLVSCIVGLVVLRIGYQRISRHAYAVFLACLALLVPLLLAKLLRTDFGGLTAPRNGAYRWFHLPGFPLQPSELMKVAYVISLAWYLRYRRNYRRFAGLMVPVAVSALPFGLILLEPDLGTALLLLPVLFTMLFAAGAKIRHLAVIALAGIAVSPFAWGQIKGYQRARVTAVILQSDAIRQAVIDRPESFGFLATKRQAIEWAASSGYQLVHSKNAVGSGGVIGQGWGQGAYARGTLLPDRHNDFVFALIAHQWGLLGAGTVLSCYVVIALAGVRIAAATTDPFGRLLAVGVLALITAQALINVGMTIGLMPVTGMTLPFVSYGGSSLLSNFLAITFLISVSQNRPFLLAGPPFEFTRHGVEKAHLLEYEEPQTSVGAPPATGHPADQYGGPAAVR